MLDTYIIDRIRREQESRERARIPLPLEAPREPERPPTYDREDDKAPKRGVVIIDFTI